MIPVAKETQLEALERLFLVYGYTASNLDTKNLEDSFDILLRGTLDGRYFVRRMKPQRYTEAELHVFVKRFLDDVEEKGTYHDKT